MTVDINNTEIFSQQHKMFAEGIGSYANLKPTEIDIQELLKSKGFSAESVEIWFDEFQGLWRWNCKIEKVNIKKQ